MFRPEIYFAPMIDGLRGGGIELSILAKHYGREISAWNIETSKGLVFGEEAGECGPRG